MSTKLPQCPVSGQTASSTNGLAKCPASIANIDPRNNMPVESQTPATGQASELSIERVTSSIPRPAESTSGHQSNTQDNWEYPSPQQFHNALLRKGYDTPENQAESMVFIHNELNEYTWGQVARWESRFHGGEEEAAKLQLASFSGIHGHLSNKARLFRYGKRILPSYFTLPEPFDRHDWIVRRPTSGQEARYVIDYYRLKDDEGDDAFYMDVRPAFDSVSNASARVAAVVLDKVASAGGSRKANWSLFSSMAIMTVIISGCLIVPMIGRR
ncbi:holocytochrome c synthase [Marasmius tenuissimus]|nr:holocytochrome c synthase [Marasmius tenuissimus]